MQRYDLKRHIFLSLIVAMMTLLFVFIFDIYQSKKRDIELELKRTIRAVHDVLEIEKENDANMIMAVIKTLKEDANLKLAFRERDRNKLLTLNEHLYEQLRLKHRITHFYFIDPAGITILRVHKPEKYGDLIERYTLASAKRTDKTSYGIELGPLGTLTLRVVEPFYDEKGLIGYLELGEEIDHLIPRIAEITDTELYISIKKKYLTRENWEEGMKMLNRISDWDMFPDDVIIAQTLREIPANVSDFFYGKKHKHDIIHNINPLIKNERNFGSIITPFMDVGGKEIGDMVIMLDITKWLASAKNSMIRDSIFFLIISSILFVILFIYLSRVENHIIGLNNKLTDDISKLKQAEDKIMASLKEKEVLMKEIHHRVKNNLAIISSLLNMQSAYIRDEKYKEMFNESISRIKTMALIHEKLYRSEDLSKIKFSDYIKDMVGRMYSSYGMSSQKVSLKQDIEKIDIEIDIAIPCGLIINELISNCFKHAFPDGREGEIWVTLRTKDKQEIELTVSDNGISFPEDLDFRKADSLGMTLVNGLVTQLHGEVELNREKGTEFKIKFRKK